MSSVCDGLPFSEEKRKYIVEVLDPVLEEVITQTIKDMPENPRDFMIALFQKRMGQYTSNRRSVLQQNQDLHNRVKQLKGTLDETVANSVPIDDDVDGLSAFSDDDSDDEVDEIPEDFKKSEASLGRARQSVSAEAYGSWNAKKEFVPPCVTKSADQEVRLKETLNKNFMFSSLEAQDMGTILLAMKECVFAPATKVISEGENGDYLFVVERGTLECRKLIDGEQKCVKEVNAGDVFGELALLYNCPRAATVVAKDECVCWQLDRESFNHVVKGSAMKRREKYQNFLKTVTLISSLDEYERSQIADALVQETFKSGDKIVTQGEPGDKFYILEEGALYAEKSGKEVMSYNSGDYFGELALMRNQPRAANVIVRSPEAKVLSMTRASFNKMLGPVGHLLARDVNGHYC
eukprot:TRINITY_DN1581_c1_g1_i1.p1 TRINITY_DN1581_c1_g1~~TRINITY_DN1581_c1_g1_i1.p1  ORF type:complete len:407 (-),score=98.67 TRINITY_DN1581_c1_g1_i1:61-1281(-)